MVDSASQNEISNSLTAKQAVAETALKVTEGFFLNLLIMPKEEGLE